MSLSPKSSMSFHVSGNETRIGQHFTFSGKLQIFQGQRDKIWKGNTLLHDVSIQLIISFEI